MQCNSLKHTAWWVYTLIKIGQKKRDESNEQRFVYFSILNRIYTFKFKYVCIIKCVSPQQQKKNAYRKKYDSLLKMNTWEHKLKKWIFVC